MFKYRIVALMLLCAFSTGSPKASTASQDTTQKVFVDFLNLEGAIAGMQNLEFKLGTHFLRDIRQKISKISGHDAEDFKILQGTVHIQQTEQLIISEDGRLTLTLVHSPDQMKTLLSRFADDKITACEQEGCILLKLDQDREVCLFLHYLVFNLHVISTIPYLRGFFDLIFKKPGDIDMAINSFGHSRGLVFDKMTEHSEQVFSLAMRYHHLEYMWSHFAVSPGITGCNARFANDLLDILKTGDDIFDTRVYVPGRLEELLRHRTLSCSWERHINTDETSDDYRRIQEDTDHFVKITMPIEEHGEDFTLHFRKEMEKEKQEDSEEEDSEQEDTEEKEPEIPGPVELCTFMRWVNAKQIGYINASQIRYVCCEFGGETFLKFKLPSYDYKEVVLALEYVLQDIVPRLPQLHDNCVYG